MIQIIHSKKLFLKMRKLDVRKHTADLGDYVGISRQKGAFVEGYAHNWSMEIFKKILGGFYSAEIQKIKYPHHRKGNKVILCWLRFDASHNSWILKTDIMDK
ncbi:hypothetical protein PR048_020202 [Dryococelus australis]|uniref:Chromo domain-containing protein n=1 Tax=Dryococelus australis TaxID=614101 RepID=A0ABQ9H5N6_9NEOP|nr:hypothetical protein PR048_020202 [Dryococelus australis]